LVIVEQNHNGLATEQLLVALSALVIDYLRAVRRLVWDAHEKNLGRTILGSVVDREESEDVHAGIDKMCEDLLVEYCSALSHERGVRFWIRSEHTPQGYGIGCDTKEDAHVECDVDPFDGTDQYLKGIREAWWSVLSFSHNGVSVLGGAVDILGGVVYLSSEEGVVKISTRTNRRENMFPLQERKLTGESVVASYKGKWRYFCPWVGRVHKLFEKKELAGVTHYGNGGSFVYALLATGILWAYIMDGQPGEPISEISPGAAFVQSAKLCLLVVKGSNIRRFNPLSGMEGRVDGIFIAACNEELAWSIAKQLQQNRWDQIVQKLESIKDLCGFRRLSTQST
jgi:fructose-1,6-bisphosphatase/inositol monophosphatase family enzyme